MTVSYHLPSIVPWTPWDQSSGSAQFPNQHSSQKTWLSSTLFNSLRRAVTASTMNHSVPPEDTPGEGRWNSVFLQPLTQGGNCYPFLSAPRQTPHAAPHRAESKPSSSNMPKLRPASCHQTVLQLASLCSASSIHKWVNFPVLLSPALFTNTKKN